MEQRNIKINKRKKEQLRINNLKEFENALKREGYKINEHDKEKFKEKVTKTFKVNSRVIDRLHICMSDEEITYRADNVKDFIDYIEKIILFEEEHNKLHKKIRGIKKLNIDRVEYERESSLKDKVDHIVKIIEKIKDNVSSEINNEEKSRLKNLEQEIDKEYLYAKDIELLKKIIIGSDGKIKEKYDVETKIKTLSIEVAEELSFKYIKANKGSIEYHNHLNSNLPRIKRLIKNINKYITVDKKDKTKFNINQSEALQDSINIAVALYDNKEFKAISGKINIKDYCKAPSLEEAIFKSAKVNKLGNLGIGYDRINDSEKKIFEEIHKQIEKNLLKDSGELILYSKWEPCPSCYFVISQFCEKYPKIKVKVKYSKSYG
ncbi:deaminase domain-containing protein [Clostridium tarantellae]|uniref:Rhoptry protein n=1 Tax=Clostridium tarantellae TaxID=39493 RepID=A0A6I1MMZ1_9CLOT|nr:deaminase domain-containing protein [Clostridium tarantellae]MPQ43838.1 hypothetical protein [Clostridium tarantellae]